MTAITDKVLNPLRIRTALPSVVLTSLASHRIIAPLQALNHCIFHYLTTLKYAVAIKFLYFVPRS